MAQTTDTQRAEKQLAKLRSEYEALRQEIDGLGYVLPGHIQKREYSCGKPNCRCMTEGTLHGPYYQWTRKVNGKTVNITLDKAIATTAAEWIRNKGRLRKLCNRLEKNSLATLQIIAKLEKI